MINASKYIFQIVFISYLIKSYKIQRADDAINTTVSYHKAITKYFFLNSIRHYTPVLLFN